ncbi:MAG: TatD family hydrolase [Coriobacteriales bacterium]|nr:TatD family hydrolase [Coriobacteriales bacterium]
MGEEEGSQSLNISGFCALHDAHVHLAFMNDRIQVAKDAAEKGSMLFSNTVVPSEFEPHAAEMQPYSNVFVGLGMHPWWIEADDSLRHDILSCYLDLIPKARYLGEIGLDFGLKHEHTRDAQVEFLTGICRQAAAEGGKVISIHAVRSAATVLDILEETGCISTCTCIFHWFSDTGSSLNRAIRAGCMFSVGRYMLASKRGLSYAAQIPLAQMLLETDDPEGEGVTWGYSAIAKALVSAVFSIAQAREKHPQGNQPTAPKELSALLSNNMHRVFL